MIDPGARDRKITIESLTVNPGAAKFPVSSWGALCAPWAAMTRQAPSNAERMLAGQLSAIGNVAFTIGYRADCDPDLVDVPKVRRVVYQGRVYDIVAAEHVGRAEEIVLRTVAKVG